jgi:hypothetical protein
VITGTSQNSEAQKKHNRKITSHHLSRTSR